jgi:hypothetical protein
MTTSIPSTALILVGVMKEPRDLEIARVLGWYRIPLRSAPKVVAVDYLAFYQTAAFGHELTTRAELLHDELDHPHVNREYYKIQLGPLESLPRPILAGKWRRITFIYTTGEYLLKAKIINDLVVQSEEREMLWKALRERADHDQSYGINDMPRINLDPSVLASLLGIKEIE